MNIEDYQNAVQFFRSDGTDTPERAALLSDPDVRAVCIAWPNCPVTQDAEKLEGLKEKHAHNWLFLWSVVSFDRTAFQQASGVASHNFRRAFMRAQLNRLIFPDGGLSRWVTAKLQAEVVGMPRRAPARRATT